MKRRKTELEIDGDKVFNMDEVPMSFDAPLSQTVDVVGAETVPITTTGHEKTGFTVVLACSETGKKLKPIMVTIKRKTIPKGKLFKGVVVHCPKTVGWIATAWKFGPKTSGESAQWQYLIRHRC